jgi:hypothetical protein
VTHFILDQSFTVPLTDDEHNRVAQRLDPCLDARGARWLRSYLSTDRLRMVCEFEAPDAEAVRQSYRTAGVNFERVWSAEVYARETSLS